MIAGYTRREYSSLSHIGNMRVHLVLAYARMRALTSTTGSFIERRVGLACVRTVEPSRVAASRCGDNCAPLGVGGTASEWRWSTTGKRRGRGGDSFSTRQPERRMRLRQSSRSPVIYHSLSYVSLFLFYRSAPLVFSSVSLFRI